MLYVVLQQKKRRKLHSVVKGSRKFKSRLYMALEENEPNMTAIKAAKKIKQKTKQPCQEDMKKIGERNLCKEEIHKGQTMVM